MRSEYLENLNNAATYFGINLNPVQIEQFAVYRRELLHWNKSLNLTSITDPKEIVYKHFADSLSIIPAMDLDVQVENLAVIDIGTGAGFPGIPLKIALPDIKLALVDSTQKKLRFVEHIVSTIGLKDVSIHASRAEELAHDPMHRESYQYVLSRAVAKLPVLAELCLPFCAPNGRFIAQKKGDIAEEVKSAHTAFNILGAKLHEVLPVTFPALDDSRFLVVVDKISSTPAGYPRRPGIPLKRPL
jgi:16S rRNA (guanine527-N7)-methyltransferase